MRVFYERWALELMISDQEPSFKAIKRDYSKDEDAAKEAHDTIKWLDGWHKCNEKADIEQTHKTL